MNNKPKAIFLMGPTASGKTDLAIALRESLPVEVISVDSALIEGLSPLPSANSEVRAKIEQKAAEFGWGVLHQDLMAIDLVSANRINPNDSQRINRALEVFYITGKTMTELIAQQGESLPYDVLQFAIAPEDRIVLHQRIEQRFHKMIALGFEQEVRKLFERGDLKIDLPSIRCVGYRQMWEYLQGDISLDEAIFKGICATRQLAKRQITWLRGWQSEITWLDSLQPERAREVVLEKWAKFSA